MWTRKNKFKNQTNFFDLQTLIITNDKIEEVEGQSKYQLTVKYQNFQIAQAIYQKQDQLFYLSWLETIEAYQGRGVGSYILDFLCKEAVKSKATLIINAVDESFINDFYFKWFQKRVDLNNHFKEGVKNRFNSFVQASYSANPKLILTPADIEWRPRKRDKISGKI